MKKLLILSFILFSLNVRASTWHTVATEEMDFDFFKGKVVELLNDIATIAVMFDEKIIENKDENEFEDMPTLKTKKAFIAAINNNQKDFNNNGTKYFVDNALYGNQKYRDYNVLMTGPLDMIEHYMGYIGSLDTALEYHVLTTAKPRGEIALQRKDRKPIRSSGDLIEYLKVAKIVKTITQESIKETLEKNVWGKF